MAGLVDDEVFRTLAAAGTPAEVGHELLCRYGGVVDRPASSAEGASLEVIAEVGEALGVEGGPGSS
jgi:hypothetical protein